MRKINGNISNINAGELSSERYSGNKIFTFVFLKNSISLKIFKIIIKQFPDGTYKKNLDSRLMKKLGWSPKIKLKEGLEKVISKRYQKVKRANR